MHTSCLVTSYVISSIKADYSAGAAAQCHICFFAVVQIRTLCYGSQLVGGVLAGKSSQSSLGKSLLLFSAQLSDCRTTLRLFDDLSMLAYSTSYGLGASVRTQDGSV